jgi:P-type Ca2+ transporter type 2C
MHRKKIDKIYEEFESTPEGLDQNAVEQSLKEHGFNIIQTKRKTPLFIEFIKEFLDLMIIILIAAAAIAYAFGHVTDATVILTIVVINAAVSFIQKFRAEKAIEALQSLTSPHAKVIRENKLIDIPAKYVVPGDILVLHAGDKIPADARIIESNALECDESILTGESQPTHKKPTTLRGKFLPKIEHSNSVFMGTTVSHGSGKAIVFATGLKTEFGKIANLTITTKQDPSPLQKELKRIGIFIASLTAVLSTILFLVGYFYQGRELIDNLLFTISVAVAAVPEGLPATITIALAFGVQRLAKKKAIMKQLSSVETLGSTTVILSDKTGTLTKNEMTVKELYFNNLQAEVKGTGYAPKGSIHIRTASGKEIVIGTDDPVSIDLEQRQKDLKSLAQNDKKIFDTFNLLAITGHLCNEAKLTKEGRNKYSIIGDPTEGAIQTFVHKAGFNLEQIENTYTTIESIPFDSTRKRMSVIVKNLHSKEILTLTKGAPQSVLERCTRIMLNGRKVDLTKEMRNMLIDKMENMAGQALRVIAFAYKEMPSKQRETYTEAQAENSLVFLGLAGMIDPPRREVKSAIAITKDAGIRTYIVTGDHGLTASAIAKQIGLKSDEIITGGDLNKMSDKKLKELLQDKTKQIIFARVSPQHKLKLVETLKELGEIVAVTGDGVNDAPALKRADIGVAMGIKGTDVAKEASNMILTDDSFSSVVRAIEEGRTIYQNMRKFIFYIFSCNIGELATVFFAVIANLPAPLTAVLILSVNVGTDLFPALALGVEDPEKGIMATPPRNPKKRLLSARFIARFTYIGLIIATIVSGVFIWNLYRFGWSWGDSLPTTEPAYIKSVTMAFATLVIIQLLNTFNARSLNRSIFNNQFFTNPPLYAAVVFSGGLLYMATEIPFLQTYLQTTSLNSQEWILIIVASLTIVVVEEFRKVLIKIHD